MLPLFAVIRKRDLHRSRQRQFCLNHPTGPIRQRHQAAGPHTEQTYSLLQGHPLKALPCGFSYFLGIGHAHRQGEIARYGMEIRITKLDADGSAGVALPLQIIGHAQAKRSKNLRQRRPVLPGMQIPFEGAFAADRLGLGLGDHRSVIDAMPEKYSQVVRLRYAEGRSISEIAERTGLTPEQVKARAAYARRFLKTHLHDAVLLWEQIRHELF